jgi:hypothetical protein
MSPWSNFFVVICAQLLFFLFLAHRKQAFKVITPSLVIKSVVAGVVFGIAFDLVVGKYLGIFSYFLHFDPVFLVINGALSYGLWILTMQLLKSERLLSFLSWTIVIGFAYEVVNHFYPVWSWTFGGSFLYQESIVILAGYCGLAILTAFVLAFTTRPKF